MISVLGDPRTNQNPALLSFGILFFRWHNVVAGRVQKEHPTWTDEEVFQRARRIVIASLQVTSTLFSILTSASPTFEPTLVHMLTSTFAN